MEITVSKVEGNTWCIDMPNVMIPYYRLNEHEIILFDSGCSRKGALENWLEKHDLKVCAILNTHNHWDHVSENDALRRRYGAKIYMPEIEAAFVATPLTFKVGCGGIYQEIEQLYRKLYFPVDETIPTENCTITICGVPIQVIQTPGHTPGHAVYITPDGVMCVGDVLMSESMLKVSKISYASSHEVDLESKKKLREYPCSAYILSHKSIETSIDHLIDENIAFVLQRAEEILRIVERPMSMEAIIRTAWQRFRLREGIYYKNLEARNMIHALVEYLTSMGKLECRYDDGVDYYARTTVRSDKNGTETGEG